MTIAGSDSGGGAGIQADLKTFHSLRVHGVCAITCVTAQNPDAVVAIEPVAVKMIVAQMEAVFREVRPRAVKTGMLYSAEIIRSVAARLDGEPKLPLVVDPVLAATSGGFLARKDAVRALRERLFPRATLITPNLSEVQHLTGMQVRTPEEMRAAARRCRAEFGCAVLVKGGHLRRGAEAVDIFYDGGVELLLGAPRVKGVKTHGTGCTYAAAITAYLAMGHELSAAVQMGKQYVTNSIGGSRRVGRHWVLDWR